MVHPRGVNSNPSNTYMVGHFSHLFVVKIEKTENKFKKRLGMGYLIKT